MALYSYAIFKYSMKIPLGFIDSVCHLNRLNMIECIWSITGLL